MNEFEMEWMMGDVAASMANASVPEGLEQRLKARVFADGETENVLVFGTLDRLTGGKQRRTTIASALMFHAALLALVFFQMRAMHERMTAPAMVESEVVLNAPPPSLPPSETVAHGGGGHAGVAPVTQGTPPPPAERQFMPPEVKPVEDAKLPVPATVAMQAQPMARLLTQDVGVVSAAPAVGVSLGNGRGSGVGGGYGSGVGPGGDGNLGGGVRRIGGGVSAPVPLYTPDPEFSEEARKAKVSGNVLVSLQVDEMGRVRDVRVLRGIGMGLDEKAVAAVREYRFKPAMENGRPVAVEMNVEVTFNIY